MQKVFVVLGVAVGLVLGFSAEAAEAQDVQVSERVAPVVEQVVPDVQFPYNFAATVAESVLLDGSPTPFGQPCTQRAEALIDSHDLGFDCPFPLGLGLTLGSVKGSLHH